MEGGSTPTQVCVDTGLEDDVDNFQCRRRLARMYGVRSLSKPKIRINIAVQKVEPEPQKAKVNHTMETSSYDWEGNDDDEIEAELADSLSFFQETHEDQDPTFVEYTRKIAEEEQQRKLAALDAYDKQARIEIETIIADLTREKQAATDRSLEKYKQRATEDEKLKTDRYQELYRQKTASNIRKINEGIEILQQRHQKDLETALAHHQQQVRSRRLSEQNAANEWHVASQNMINKHKIQLSGFRDKGSDLKKQTETDYQREQDKIHKQHMLRLQEVDSSRQKLHARLYVQIQQLRQRYLKRHSQKIMTDKEELLVKDPSAAMALRTNSLSSDNGDDVEGDTLSEGLTKYKVHREGGKPSIEDHAELNPSSPIRSAEKWVDCLPYPFAGAATRHKHRKGVLSQTVRQVSIEIHNEGLWFSACPVEPMDNGSYKKAASTPAAAPVAYEFLPWGAKSHQILDAIVCGEIPCGICERIMDQHVNATEIMSVQAGQVRCIVSDLRTSDETASAHRVVALAEQEGNQLKELDQKVVELQKIVSDAESAYARTTKEEKSHTTAMAEAGDNVKKATRIQDEFKQKFKSFLGPDGTPSMEASPNDRHELSKAMARYSNDLASAVNAAKTAKQALADAKSKVLKLQSIVKSAQKNFNAAAVELKKKQAMGQNQQTAGGRSENSMKLFDAADMADRASYRVKDVIGALRKTADRRRDQAEQKKSTSFSSAWVQSFPGLPSSLKKSLWHKMHRRKQQVILRPSPESFTTELRAIVATIVAAKYSGRRSADMMELIESEQMNAEQLFLLAMYPLADGTGASVPPTRSGDGWAEPGSQLNLSTPNVSAHRTQMILPCAGSFPVLENNLSEIASSPGRQAASLIRTSHFSCLSSPLSSFAIASSPAESNTSLTSTRTFHENDPLNITTDDMTQGYAFTLKQVSKPAAPRRRSSSSKAASESENAGDAPQGMPAEDIAKSSGNAIGKSPEPKKSESKRRRSSSSKKSSTVQPSSSSRSKKQKPDTIVPTPIMPSTVAPHFNAMMQQQPPTSQHSQRQQQQMHHQQRQHIPPIQQQQVLHQQRQSQHHQAPRHQQQHSSQLQSQHQQPQNPHQQQHPQQQQYSPQMAQLRMMQQQQVISPRHQQVPTSYPPQTIQHMQQFYAPLNHPPPPMHMQPRPGPPHPPPQQPPQGQTSQPRNQGGPNDTNDPLFMLK